MICFIRKLKRKKNFILITEQHICCSKEHAQIGELIRIWEQMPKIDCLIEWNAHIVIKYTTNFRCVCDLDPIKVCLKYLGFDELRLSVWNGLSSKMSLLATVAQSNRTKHKISFIFMMLSLTRTYIDATVHCWSLLWLHNNGFFARTYVKKVSCCHNR